MEGRVLLRPGTAWKSRGDRMVSPGQAGCSWLWEGKQLAVAGGMVGLPADTVPQEMGWW